MKPININPRLRSNCWKPARRVWFQKNDDRESTEEILRKHEEMQSRFRKFEEEQAKMKAERKEWEKGHGIKRSAKWGHHITDWGDLR